MGNNSLAWHYTLGLGMAGIAQSMTIRPSTQDVPAGELPIVWFSKAAFEPTIAELGFELPGGKMLRPRGAAQFRLMGMGLYRLGVPAHRLTEFKTLAKQAGMGGTRRRKLEKIAASLGSYPHHWMGCFEPVDLRDDALPVEFQFHDGNDWVRVELARAMSLVREQQALIEPALVAFIERAKANGRA